MAGSTKVALLYGILVFLQVLSCADSRPHAAPGKSLAVNVPAMMTLNGFQEGEGGGGPAACDGQFHGDDEFSVSLSSEWYAGGARCNKAIRINNNANNLQVIAWVVDECGGCDREMGGSARIWSNFNLDPSVGEWSISWSDVV